MEQSLDQYSTTHVVGDSSDILQAPSESKGAIWKMDISPRQLDINIVAIPAGEKISWHDGPELDVFIHILEGSGEIFIGADAEKAHAQRTLLTPGVMVNIPRRAYREIVAGDMPLRYLNIHTKKPGLGIKFPARDGEV
ncbi:MAG: cupin domain-containing protein [Corynebacterium sp.]|nr:cupin domain-containing protein [Corynebacterium sp.]